MNSQYGNMGYQRRVQGEQSVIMHADDAEARGIEDGQPIRVFNERGEFRGLAQVSSGNRVARGVVVFSLGQ